MSNIELISNSGIVAYHFIPTYGAWRPGIGNAGKVPHLRSSSSSSRKLILGTES